MKVLDVKFYKDCEIISWEANDVTVKIKNKYSSLYVRFVRFIHPIDKNRCVKVSIKSPLVNSWTEIHRIPVDENIDFLFYQFAGMAGDQAKTADRYNKEVLTYLENDIETKEGQEESSVQG